MSMTRIRHTAALAVVASLATGAWLGLIPLGPASADEAEITDPVDGIAGHPDVVSAQHGHTPAGKLEHTIATDENFETEDAPCLHMKALRPPREFILCGDGLILRTADQSQAGIATINRPDESTIVYRFGPTALDKPKAYWWRVLVLDEACASGLCDAAPDASWVEHRQAITYGRWAASFLEEVDAPDCQNNLTVVVAWEVNEGTDARFNPLATTYPMPGASKFNSIGVRDYVSLAQGLEATRLTLERGWNDYGYSRIVKRLRNCAPARRTARAIKRSSWCAGCTNGRYVIGLIPLVESDYDTYAARYISTD